MSVIPLFFQIPAPSVNSGCSTALLCRMRDQFGQRFFHGRKFRKKMRHAVYPKVKSIVSSYPRAFNVPKTGTLTALCALIAAFDTRLGTKTTVRGD